MKRKERGGTGLYAASQAGLGEMLPVNPASNSLLLFECSPHSRGAGATASSCGCTARLKTRSRGGARAAALPVATAGSRPPGRIGQEKETPRRAFCIQGDLTSKADVRRIVEVALARFGRIDAVVNSAADTHDHGRMLELTFDTSSVEQQLLTNCVAPMDLISAIFQESWKNERADNRKSNRSVINVSSISGLCIFPSVDSLDGDTKFGQQVSRSQI
jgi:NAD(P)-dependent dehydrogenase (short-subunit alcohol dehydrogenase family)